MHKIPEKFNLHNYSNILHKTLNWNDIQNEHINGHTTFFVKLNKIESNNSTRYFIEYYIRTKHLVNNNLIQTHYSIYRQLVSLLNEERNYKQIVDCNNELNKILNNLAANPKVTLNADRICDQGIKKKSIYCKLIFFFYLIFQVFDGEIF